MCAVLLAAPAWYVGFSGGLLAMNPQVQGDLRLSTTREAPVGVTAIGGVSSVLAHNTVFFGPYGGMVLRGGKPGVGFGYVGAKVNPVDGPLACGLPWSPAGIPSSG